MSKEVRRGAYCSLVLLAAFSATLRLAYGFSLQCPASRRVFTNTSTGNEVVFFDVSVVPTSNLSYGPVCQPANGSIFSQGTTTSTCVGISDSWVVQTGTPQDDGHATEGASVAAADDDGTSFTVVATTFGTFVNGTTQPTSDGDIMVLSVNASGQENWRLQLNTSTTPNAEDVAAAVVSRGSFTFLGGYTKGVVGGPNQQEYDAFVIKYQGQNELWRFQLGSNNNKTDEGKALAIDSKGSVVLAGHTQGAIRSDVTNAGTSNLFAVKINASGSEEWRVQLNSTNSTVDSWCTAVVAGADDSFTIVGYTNGAFGGPFQGGTYDVFVLKLNSAGQEEWRIQFGSNGSDISAGAALNSEGHLYVTGDTTGALAGQSRLPTSSSDVFLVKLNSSSIVWQKQLASSGADLAWDVNVNSKGEIFVVGSTYSEIANVSNLGSLDAFLLMFDGTSGSVLWRHQFGTSSDDEATSITFANGDSPVVVGVTRGALPGSSSHGGQDIFVMKFQYEACSHNITVAMTPTPQPTLAPTLLPTLVPTSAPTPMPTPEPCKEVTLGQSPVKPGVDSSFNTVSNAVSWGSCQNGSLQVYIKAGPTDAVKIPKCQRLRSCSDESTTERQFRLDPWITSLPSHSYELYWADTPGTQADPCSTNGSWCSSQLLTTDDLSALPGGCVGRVSISNVLMNCSDCLSSEVAETRFKLLVTQLFVFDSEDLLSDVSVTSRGGGLYDISFCASGTDHGRSIPVLLEKYFVQAVGSHGFQTGTLGALSFPDTSRIVVAIECKSVDLTMAFIVVVATVGGLALIALGMQIGCTCECEVIRKRVKAESPRPNPMLQILLFFLSIGDVGTDIMFICEVGRLHLWDYLICSLVFLVLPIVLWVSYTCTASWNPEYSPTETKLGMCLWFASYFVGPFRWKLFETTLFGAEEPMSPGLFFKLNPLTLAIFLLEDAPQCILQAIARDKEDLLKESFWVWASVSFSGLMVCVTLFSIWLAKRNREDMETGEAIAQERLDLKSCRVAVIDSILQQLPSRERLWVRQEIENREALITTAMARGKAFGEKQARNWTEDLRPLTALGKHAAKKKAITTGETAGMKVAEAMLKCNTDIFHESFPSVGSKQDPIFDEPHKAFAAVDCGSDAFVLCHHGVFCLAHSKHLNCDDNKNNNNADAEVEMVPLGEVKEAEEARQREAQEARRREQEAKEAEEARQREEEEARRREQEAKEAEEARQREEEEARRREQEAKEAEEARQREEEEARRREQEAKEAEEARQREEEEDKYTSYRRPKPPESMISPESQVKYTIGKTLGQGHFKTAFLARTDTGKLVAVSVMQQHTTESMEEMKREAAFVEKIDHPNILKLIEMFQCQQQLVLVCEYVAGNTLDAQLREFGRVEPPQALEYAYQLLGALSHLASKRIVHGDLKPDNILVTADGQLKLNDFGLSQQMPDKARRIPATQVYPPFLDPDAVDVDVNNSTGEEAYKYWVSPATDVYAAGLVIVEMATGERIARNRTEVYELLKKKKCPTLVTSFLEQKNSNLAKLQELVHCCVCPQAERRTARQLLVDGYLPRMDLPVMEVEVTPFSTASAGAGAAAGSGSAPGQEQEQEQGQ